VSVQPPLSQIRMGAVASITSLVSPVPLTVENNFALKSRGSFVR